VSRLCHDPRIAVAVLHQMMAPHQLGGRLFVMHPHRPLSALTQGDRVTGVVVRGAESGRDSLIEAPFFIDATPYGDLPGEDHTIERPKQYQHWRTLHQLRRRFRAKRHHGGQLAPERLLVRAGRRRHRGGLAPAPYVRESRRIRAAFTVREQHIAYPLRPDGPERFDDSVGIGCYRIDLIPVRVQNLLPGGKNLGVTHIANGAFRVHPVEWNVGEAAGALAAFCLERNVPASAVRERRALLVDFQSLLVRLGIELAWPTLTPV
jgi:hypothetical protein